MEMMQLEHFVLLAEHLHYRRAASLSGVSASTLSRQITDLESEVGARLFERNRRGVRLTAAGRVFLPEVQETLHRLRFAAIEARRVGAGAAERVRIGHGDALAVRVLQHALPVVREEHPDLRLQVVEAPSTRLYDRLCRSELDLALVRPPLADGLVGELLCLERLVAVVPAGSVLARRKRLRADDLLGEPLVVPERTMSPGEHDAVMAALGAVGSAAEVAEEASSTASLLLMIGAGLGVGLVAEGAVEHLDVDGVVALPLAGSPSVELWASWREGHETPVVKSVLNAVRAAVADIAGPRARAGEGGPSDDDLPVAGN